MIGVFAAFAEHLPALNGPARLLLVTGVLGGFTTFSAFGLETMLMLRRGDTALAGGYVAASLVLGSRRGVDRHEGDHDRALIRRRRNASRVRFSGSPSVHATLSSMRMPPYGRNASTRAQSTLAACGPARRSSSSMSMK